MIEVFFRGYGCWFFKHRKSGRTYSIGRTDNDKFFLFPAHDKFDFLKSFQSIGLFNMTKEDAFEFRRTKNHSMVRKLFPSSRYQSNATFTETTYSFFKDIFDSTITEITDQVEVGGSKINAEDCYFLIDTEQQFVFDVEELDELTNTKTTTQVESIRNSENIRKQQRGKPRHNDALALLRAAVSEIKLNTGENPEVEDLVIYVLKEDFAHQNIQNRDPVNISIKRRKLELTDGTKLDATGIRRRYKETILKNNTG